MIINFRYSNLRGYFKKRYLVLAAFIFLIFIPQPSLSQKRTLTFYQDQAHQNNAALKENNNSFLLNNLQNKLTTTQFLKPQFNISSDYLFAPFFYNRGRFISVTSNPEKNAYGYDVGLTNGGLYAAQLNATFPLLTAGIVKTYNNQNEIQNQILTVAGKQALHDLDKNISDQYIATLQLQQQAENLQKIISLIFDRQKIVEALVLKGVMQQSDYLLLQIELKQRQFDVQQLAINLSSAFNQLNNLCGINDTIFYDLQVPLIEQTQQLTQFNYYQKFKLDSAAIIAQQSVTNVKYKPQLAAFANSGVNGSDAANVPHNVGISAGLHLLIPLYDGTQKKVVQQQNKILIENLMQYKVQNNVSTSNNLNALQQQISLTRQSISLIGSQIAAQETLLLILKDKILNGQVSVTDYIVALQDYSASNQSKVQLQTNLWLLINQYNYVNW